MAIEKINFHYPNGTLQSVFEGEAKTALELSALTSKKVDECVEVVNGVELIATNATAIVDEMKLAQEQFITENNDVRTGLIEDNQSYIDTLTASKTLFDTNMNNALTTTQTDVNLLKDTFENTMNTTLSDFQTDIGLSKTTFENTMNTELTSFKTNINAEKQTFIDTSNDILDEFNSVTVPNAITVKFNELLTNGTISNVINEELFSDINVKIDSIAKYITADNTGTINASDSINLMLTSATNGDEIHFHSGTYLIDKTINWNKKITLIADGKVTLKAVGAIDSIIEASNFTSYADVRLPNFYFDGNNLANYCIKLNGSTGANYVTKVIIKNCDCKRALLDGIIIVPPAWNLLIENTMLSESGRDGIRAIMTESAGINQINNCKLDGCVILDNDGMGINILGANINIVHCNIERNKIGINCDSLINSVSYDSYLINIKNNYIENNIDYQIYLGSQSGDGMIINIEGNYLNGSATSTTVIKCGGNAESIILNMSKNRINNAITANILDGGNALHSSSLITSDLYLRESKFINLGMARIEYDRFEKLVIPVSTGIGAKAFDAFTTENLIPLTTRIVKFPVIKDMMFKYIRLVTAKIISDCSDFNIMCYVNEWDVLTGVKTKATSFTITGSNNLDFTGNIANNWGYYRVPTNKVYEVRFDVISYTGTTLSIAFPSLTLI